MMFSAIQVRAVHNSPSDKRRVPRLRACIATRFHALALAACAKESPMRTANKIPCRVCPSCGHSKASAAKNVCGLCDECNGGPNRKRAKRVRRVPVVPESIVSYMKEVAHV